MLPTLVRASFRPLGSDWYQDVRREMDEMFNDVFTRGGEARTYTPAPLTVWEDEQGVILEVDVPGVSQEQLEITVREGKLRIAGSRSRSALNAECWRDERNYGSFERFVSLPEWIDANDIDANLHSGVLTVKLKKKPEAKPIRVKINTHDEKARLA